MGPEPATEADKEVWRAIGEAIARASDICAQRRAELRRLSEENYRLQGTKNLQPVVVTRQAASNGHHQNGKHKHRR